VGPARVRWRASTRWDNVVSLGIGSLRVLILLVSVREEGKRGKEGERERKKREREHDRRSVLDPGGRGTVARRRLCCRRRDQTVVKKEENRVRARAEEVTAVSSTGRREPSSV